MEIEKVSLSRGRLSNSLKELREQTLNIFVEITQAEAISNAEELRQERRPFCSGTARPVTGEEWERDY